MQISYTNNNENMIEAVDFVNKLSSKEDFWSEVAEHPKFDNTDVKSEEICRRLRACTKAVTVQHWKFDEERKKTVAATDPSRPYRIYYHTRFLTNLAAAMVNTLVHEFVHNVDMFDDGVSTNEYTHNGQRARDNQGTAPYWIGDLAQHYYVVAHSGVSLLDNEARNYAEQQEFECEIVKVDDDEIE
jgi:hypothetical protein